MFWLMGNHFLRDAQLWDDERDCYLDPVICPLDPGHRHAVRHWRPALFREEPKLEGMLPLNRKFDAFATPRASFVFSRSAFAALEKEPLTGWQMNPTRISFSDQSTRDDFGELWVNGFGGVASPSSGCKILWRCRACGWGHYQEGVVLSEAVKQARWDGSGFFVVWPFFNKVICTDRAKKVLEHYRTDEVFFRNAEEVIEPEQFSYGDAPVPPYYKPEARAEIEAFWAKAPVWPDDFEKPSP